MVLMILIHSFVSKFFPKQNLMVFSGGEQSWVYLFEIIVHSTFFYGPWNVFLLFFNFAWKRVAHARLLITLPTALSVGLYISISELIMQTEGAEEKERSAKFWEQFRLS